MEIICYLSNGYPTIEASYNMAMEYADAGCKMMEVDFPSRNPYLESDYIAGRMEKALESCDDYEKYMDSIVAIKNKLPDVKILVLAYENTVEEIGTQEFIDFCLDNDAMCSSICRMRRLIWQNSPMVSYIFKQNRMRHRKRMQNIRH